MKSDIFRIEVCVCNGHGPFAFTYLIILICFRYLEKERERSHALIHFPDGLNNQDWARPKLEASGPLCRRQDQLSWLSCETGARVWSRGRIWAQVAWQEMWVFEASAQPLSLLPRSAFAFGLVLTFLSIQSTNNFFIQYFLLSSSFASKRSLKTS